MKIGLLLPRSVIYPSLSFDLVDGLKAGLAHAGFGDSYQIISAGIGIAGKNEEVYAKCEQLLIEGADVIAAYINPGMAECIHPLFVSTGKLLIVLDSGYHFPESGEKLSNAYFISLQGTLCAREIAAKAVRDGNSRFAFSCSFFDAGYRTSYSMATAAEHHGGSIVFNHVTPLKKAEFTLAPLAEYLENNASTALLTLFCGDMTEDFFRESLRSGLLHKHSMYCSGFTADEEWLRKIPYPGKDLECAVPWSVEIDTLENRKFVEAVNDIRAERATLFSLLGWEAALLIAATKGKCGAADGLELRTPRGTLYFNPFTAQAEAPVYFGRIVQDSSTGNCRIAGLAASSHSAEERDLLAIDVREIRKSPANAWLNAYACLES